MAYEIKKDADCVILHVLAGALPSVVGLKVRDAEIISMTYKEYFNIASHVFGGEYVYGSLHDIFRDNLIFAFNENDEIIVLETVLGSNNGCGVLEDSLLDAMRLYKSEDIYSCHMLSYRYENEHIIGGGIGTSNIDEHAHTYMPARYTLNDKEKEEFPVWFDKYGDIPRTQFNDSFKNMLRFYKQSYLVNLPNLQYIMLFAILEMALGARSEITYQISRGTALLLSKDRAEMNEIYQEMKKLYNARSKFVHEGKSISIESLYALREIVRRTLIKLIDLNYHLTDKKMSDLKEEICLGGYGSFNKIEENPNV